MTETKGYRAECQTHHLDQDATDDNNRKDIRAHMGQLVVSRKRQLERHAKALSMSPLIFPGNHPPRTHLDRHDRDAPDQRADAEVHERRFGPMGGDDLVDHVGGEDGDKANVAEEGEPGGVVEDLVDRLDFLV